MKHLLLAALLVLPLAARADDAELRAAAERYEAVAGIGRMLNDAYESIAARLPEEKRAAFIAAMNELIDAEQLRQIALDAMVKYFTVEELDALSEFYGTPVGQSILAKFGAYNAEVTPGLMQLVLSAAEGASRRLEQQ